MNKGKISTKVLFMILLLYVIAIFSGCSTGTDLSPMGTDGTESEERGHLEVHFIDVGQADAILIKAPGNQNIMIDGGNNADGDLVVQYIKDQGVRRFNAVIGTHPHEDHIGGLDEVIKNFEIEKIYLPNIIHNTKTFEDVLKAVEDKGLRITAAAKGVKLPLEGLEAFFLGPVSSAYTELNNYSAVLKLTYGNNSFLFQGDAEAISEREILDSHMASHLMADVLKIGHHGSRSSTTVDYLEKVNPKYGVLMVGQNNDYGHPHRETMNLLAEKNIEIFRTDEQGTIVATSDGKSIAFNKTPSPNDNASDQLYMDDKGNGIIKGNINKNGEKIYHMPGGAYYDSTIPEEWFKTEREAQAAGFRKSSR